MADWVELGTTVMKTARERLGLSYEAVARAVPVSSKTYERYEKRGRVPRPLLPKIASILELEVEAPERVRVTVDGETPSGDRLEEVLGAVARLQGDVDEVLALLRARGEGEQAEPEAP